MIFANLLWYEPVWAIPIWEQTFLSYPKVLKYHNITISDSTRLFSDLFFDVQTHEQILAQ